MASGVKTIVATGASSGVGFEAVKQLLEASQPYLIIIGVRDTKTVQAAFDDVKFDRTRNELVVLPLDLVDLRGTNSFAKTVLEKIGQGPIDYLFLNAAARGAADKPGSHGSRWCDAFLVNHLSQHYLIHLLRPKLEDSRARIIMTCSGGIRSIKDTSRLDKDLLANSGVKGTPAYNSGKFTQLLGAHWWRRQLEGKCDVLATSPGLVPMTKLMMNSDLNLDMTHPDAKTNAEGGANLINAFFRDDFPEDRNQIFLTSWGEWWPISVIENSVDRALQDKWCFSKEEIEKDAGISS